MIETADLAIFYLINMNEDVATVRGPYNMTQAEELVQPHEKIITRQKFTELSSLKPQEVSDETAYQAQNSMLRRIRSWGISLLLLGGIHLVSSGFLNSSWGILLFIVGIGSFFFRSPAMFVIYGVTLAWAGLSNLLSGSGNWLFFSLLQFYLTFQMFRQFFYFRRSQENLSHINIENVAKDLTRTTQVFPWAGCILGLFGLFGFVLAIISIFVFIGFGGGVEVPGGIILLEGMAVNLAILGFAIGLASLLSRHPRKPVAIGGMVAGGLVVLAELGFNFFA